MGLKVIILAAGQGKRLRSNLPKVLHDLAGKPLLHHVIQTAKAIDPEEIVIVVGGQTSEAIKARFQDSSLIWVQQDKPLGTGDAVKCALETLSKGDRVVILCGDVPLLHAHTLDTLLSASSDPSLGIVTAHIQHPEGYGRILRDEQDMITGIVETKDATESQRLINEVNAGIYCATFEMLQRWLPVLNPANASAEYYLTDIVAQAVKDKISVVSVQPEDIYEIGGVNTRAQLALLERHYQQLQAQSVMEQGASLLDPARFDVRGFCQVERDVCIDVNVLCEGDVFIGESTTIGPHVVLRNVKIGRRVEIKAFCHIEGAEILDDCVVGPFARIRPGTCLSDNVKVGNFVEIKNSSLGKDSKVNHLSYVGDTEMGERVNVGAGTITCNYDGVNKYKTMIKDDAFIGSNTALIAPITVGEAATVGAGSTLNCDAPDHALTVSRARQKSLPAWKRPEKNIEE